MSIKQISLLITILLLASCGSTKQVVNTSEGATPKTEEQINTTEIEPDTEPTIEQTEEKEIVAEPVNPNSEEIITETIEIPEEPIENISHNSWNELLQKHVSVNGNVNYKGFKSDSVKFYAYIEHLQNNAPNNLWTRNDKLAYWINAYNAFTIDLILRNYPLQSIKDIKEPWDQRLWKIDSKWYTLNDIEHQILRKMDEPRIHFAIVCASVSCPKLKNTAFTAFDLETQLTVATKEFLSDTSKNELSVNNIKLSKIFKWFAKDFKTNGSMIDFLNQNSDIKISDKAKKSYLDYNWDLND
ncbi:DUF547 domain-containing protein [Psychroserpens sp.]|uniref:DUF547 domain-containing protein n=1 Tax=Psychroserpens sp. TaxID=2020870 RepID=UPI00385AF2BD